MERKTAADFDQEVLILFDAYVHGNIDRRRFLEKASKYAVGGDDGRMLLEQLRPEIRRGAADATGRQAPGSRAHRISTSPREPGR